MNEQDETSLFQRGHLPVETLFSLQLGPISPSAGSVLLGNLRSYGSVAQPTLQSHLYLHLAPGG